MKGEKIGFVSNYFSKISVAAIEIADGTLSVGDTIHFLGHTTEFESTVHSMQIEHYPHNCTWLFTVLLVGVEELIIHMFIYIYT